MSESKVYEIGDKVDYVFPCLVLAVVDKASYELVRDAMWPLAYEGTRFYYIKLPTNVCRWVPADQISTLVHSDIEF